MPSGVEIGSLIERIRQYAMAAEDCGHGTDCTPHRRLVKMGMSPEAITLEYPHLTLAQVHAVLAYYHANSEEIEADIAQEDQLSADWERQLASDPKGG